MKKTKKPPSKPCLTPKPLTDFPKVTENPDGRRNTCKQCEREVRKEKKEREAEYAKQYFTF